VQSSAFLGQNETLVSAILVRALVEVVDPFGVSQARLVKAAGVDECRLTQHLARFTCLEFDRLQCAAMDLTGADTLGLLLASKVSDGAFGVAAHVAAHAPSLREALHSSAKFGATLYEGTRLELREQLGQAELRYAFPRMSARSDRMFSEFVIAGLMRLVRLCARGEPLGAAAYFEHAAPADTSPQRAEFGEMVYFSRSFTGLVFRRELLDAAPIHHQPELHDLMYAEAERALEELREGAPLSGRLRSYLATFKPPELPTMENASRALGMSPRSLRRRLADEGTSYRTLVRSVVALSAARWVRHEHGSLKEVAAALGFSDPAAFNRAFKRWTGITPGAFKRASACVPRK
jgi:AraC-like DNA-binding protein